MAKCRGCGEEILWIGTKEGSWHPCNPEKVKANECEPGDKIVSTNGIVYSVVENDSSGAWGYHSHFSTCPAADDFRKSKAKARVAAKASALGKYNYPKRRA